MYSFRRGQRLGYRHLNTKYYFEILWLFLHNVPLDGKGGAGGYFQHPLNAEILFLWLS